MDSFKGKKVLITGSTGLIGHCLVEKLIDYGANVIASGRSIERLTKTFVNRGFQCKCLAFDISKDCIPDSVGIVDYIFHAASPISGVEISEKPVDVIDANIKGARNCLEYLRLQQKQTGHKGKFIVFSSATIYGNNTDGDISVKECDTNIAGTLEANNACYAESKRMIEVLARSYCEQYGVEIVIARIGWVYGYSLNIPNTAFYSFCKNAVNGEDIILKNSGLPRRDNIHVFDVVNGLLTVALRGNSGSVYNISSNGEYGNFASIDEMAREIGYAAKKNGVNVDVVIPNANKKRQGGIRMDNTALKNLGWNLQMSLEDGIEQTLLRYFNRSPL